MLDVPIVLTSDDNHTSRELYSSARKREPGVKVFCHPDAHPQMLGYVSSLRLNSCPREPWSQTVNQAQPFRKTSTGHDAIHLVLLRHKLAPGVRPLD